MTKYWRIRLKNQDGDFTHSAWDRQEIGIWYGAWGAEDFRNINIPGRSIQCVTELLNGLPAQQHLIENGAWDRPLQTSSVSTSRRFFDSVEEGDWVVLYLEDNQAIALGQLGADVQSDVNHPLNSQAGEIFKFRRISNQKTFALADLPDAFRLVPAQGRSNVHQFTRMYEHVRLLANHENAIDIVTRLGNLNFDQQLSLMGASAWESFCVAWLIMERHFVPTGLSTGRTLRSVDIVGRNTQTGNRIIAQCKKDPNQVEIEEDFINTLVTGDEGYYFAYGGCRGEPSAHIQVISGQDARNWAENNENGQLFKQLFLGLGLPEQVAAG